MKQLFRFLIVVSIGVFLAAACGFSWYFVGWALSGAFSSVVHLPDSPVAHARFMEWILCLCVSFAVLLTLVVVYRREYSRRSR